MKSQARDDDDGCFQQEAIEQQVRERHEIDFGEANPIYTKHKSEEPTVTIKYKYIYKRLLQLQKPDFVSNFIPFKLNNKQEKGSTQAEQSYKYNHLLKFDSPFTAYYDADQLVYQKYNNEAFNKFKDIRYYAGFFIPKNLIYDSIKETSVSLHQLCDQYIEKPIKTSRTPRNTKNVLPQQFQKEQQLIFDSNFESGNLFAVFKTNKYSYDLIMQNDINSRGSNQWFYFSVQKMLQNVQYTFTIVNFTKRDSLFNYGLRPAYYSTMANKKNGDGWFRFGNNVSYFKGEINRQNSMRFYYSLRFTITNKYSNDKIYLSHSYPYTYSKLTSYLDDLLKPQAQNTFVTKISIGNTMSGRPIHCLKIASKSNIKKQGKKAIIILARQHPGQSQGSYVCEGVINKLLEKSVGKKEKQAEFIRKNFITYVIPMVNIDGVVFGNYRTNLAGKDLNRKWDSNQREWVCPEVSAIKNFIYEISKQIPIRFILDLHGHSKKMGSFFYGNPCQQNPENVRIYPYMCSRLNTGIQYMDCTFHIDQSKKKAARVFLSIFYKQLHVYTFESSFYGYMKNQKNVEFTPQEYANLGETLIQALYIQLENDNKVNEMSEKLNELQKQKFEQGQNNLKNQNKKAGPLTANVLYQKFFNELKSDNILLGVGVEDQSGSQSQPEEGEINNAEITVELKKQKTKNGKQTKEKQDPKTCEKVPKSSVIRITNRKHHNTVQYKDLSKPVRNLKFLALSQVNAVLPDKYHISLQPLEKRTIVTQQTASVQCQTQSNQKLPHKKFSSAQISQKNNLFGETELGGRKTSHSNKHSDFMPSLQKNQIFRADLATEEPLIKRRERSIKRYTKTVFTQTILSYKNVYYTITPKPADKKSLLKITTQNEARIARMEQINLEVLRVYSRRSAIIDIGIKNKGQKPLVRNSYLSSSKKKQGYHF